MNGTGVCADACLDERVVRVDAREDARAIRADVCADEHVVREDAREDVCAIKVTHVTVKPDRFECIVQVSPGAPHLTTPAIAQRVSQARPSLLRHTCKNSCGTTFGACISNTSLPHVLEHLVIDNMCASDATPQSVLFTGTTRWLNKENGKARVEFNYVDDVVAMRALTDALSELNKIVLG